MFLKLLRFVQLLAVALVAGAMFGVWVGLDPRTLSAAAYVEQQQRTIESFEVLMPVLGGLAILLTLLLAALERGRRPVFALLAAAAVLLAVAGLVTRFQCQPIDARVMTWRAQAAPADWALLRDAWWQWHVVRSVAGLAALGLVLGATLAERRAP